MHQLVIRDLQMRGSVAGESGDLSRVIIKGVVSNKSKVQIIFAFESQRFSNFTCVLTDTETVCLRGSYWSIESFENAVQRYLANQKEVMLTT